MSNSIARVSVRLLDKDYQVACRPEERTDLLESAEFLNRKMREIRDSGKVVGLDRIAVMAALNLANELLNGRSEDARLLNELGERLRTLTQRVEACCADGRQLEL